MEKMYRVLIPESKIDKHCYAGTKIDAIKDVVHWYNESMGKPFFYLDKKQFTPSKFITYVRSLGKRINEFVTEQHPAWMSKKSNINDALKSISDD